MGAPAGDDGLSDARFETLAIHAGQEPEKLFGAVNVPIYQTATYAQDEVGSPKRWDYARGGNPTREALEVALAALEGGDRGFAFGSGMAAEATLLMTLRPGDHVVLADDAYGGTYRLLSSVLAPWQLGSSTADLRDPSALEAQITSATKIVWVETPSNPLLKVVDIAAVAKIIHNAGALCVCDNTWAPVLQRPFDLGADLVLHSTTKYFGGHCDVAGGIVIARIDNEFFQSVHTIQYSGGAVPSPFDCWLILRGMRTLPWRMRAHSENATSVAEFLAQHQCVERVHYPGLQSHPGHEIARRQMSMFGGMLSFEVTGSREAAMNTSAKTKIFVRATSLGGVESLIEHRASIEGAGTTSPENLLRLSIGLENADDLIEDLDQALG